MGDISPPQLPCTCQPELTEVVPMLPHSATFYVHLFSQLSPPCQQSRHPRWRLTLIVHTQEPPALAPPQMSHFSSASFREGYTCSEHVSSDRAAPEHWPRCPSSSSPRPLCFAVSHQDGVCGGGRRGVGRFLSAGSGIDMYLSFSSESHHQSPPRHRK